VSRAGPSTVIAPPYGSTHCGSVWPKSGPNTFIAVGLYISKAQHGIVLDSQVFSNRPVILKIERSQHSMPGASQLENIWRSNGILENVHATYLRMILTSTPVALLCQPGPPVAVRCELPHNAVVSLANVVRAGSFASTSAGHDGACRRL
jgi:hypothetical protein